MIDRLHAAIEAQQVLRLDYRDKNDHVTRREVEPLCLSFWGGTWTLGVWCRLRQDFRNFRPDRIGSLCLTTTRFESASARDLEAYLRSMGADPDAVERIRSPAT